MRESLDHCMDSALEQDARKSQVQVDYVRQMHKCMVHNHSDKNM